MWGLRHCHVACNKWSSDEANLERSVFSTFQPRRCSMGGCLWLLSEDRAISQVVSRPPAGLGCRAPAQRHCSPTWRSRLKAHGGIEEDASPGQSHGQGHIRALTPVRGPRELSRKHCPQPRGAALPPQCAGTGLQHGRDGALTWERRGPDVGRDRAVMWAEMGP